MSHRLAHLNVTDQKRQQLQQAMQQCRQRTLALFQEIDYDTLCRQAHPEFSPIGWHLGHIAYTEALWLLEHSAKKPRQFSFGRLFIADGLPKAERQKLPTLAEIQVYLDTIRAQVLDYLETADLNQQERLWRWLIQHESQHSETIAFVLELLKVQTSPVIPDLPNTRHLSEMIEIPAGYFEMGSDSIEALDNERPVHRVYLDTYSIDRYPTTCGQYQEFMNAGGYHNPKWWSNAGWQWQQQQQVTQPLYWQKAIPDHPVFGVSWYEAEAYARFVGKRLPTEAEWEKAASWDAMRECRYTYPWGNTALDLHKCNYDCAIAQTTSVDSYPNGQSAYGCFDMLGNVWEWTTSLFQGYPGFTHYPYIGYSQVYFDEQHYVLRGGSWATRPWALRCSFRNWYHPHIRQIFAGFRCAK
jgi:ergothioneine biosynthesis protein EgtB